MQEEQPLQVARCTKIIQGGDNEDAKYVINVKQIAKFVVELVRHVSPTDIEEGMRVGYVLLSSFYHSIINMCLVWIVQNIKSKYHYHQRLILQLP